MQSNSRKHQAAHPLRIGRIEIIAMIDSRKYDSYLPPWNYTGVSLDEQVYCTPSQDADVNPPKSTLNSHPPICWHYFMALLTVTLKNIQI